MFTSVVGFQPASLCLVLPQTNKGRDNKKDLERI